MKGSRSLFPPAPAPSLRSLASMGSNNADFETGYCFRDLNMSSGLIPPVFPRAPPKPQDCSFGRLYLPKVKITPKITTRATSEGQMSSAGSGYEAGRNICGNHPRDDCCRVPMCRLPPVSPPSYMCSNQQQQQLDQDCEPAPNCVDLSPRVKAPQNYQAPCSPFEGNSLYRTHFRGCYSPPANSCKPEDNVGYPGASMDTSTVYRQDYPWKCGELRSPIKAKEEYDPPCSPFEGASTYKNDYRGVYSSPAESTRRIMDPDHSYGKMDGCSSYCTDYVPYCSAEYSYARRQPLKPNQTPAFSCQPFSGASTYKTDFLPVIASRTPSSKPNTMPEFPGVAFRGRSTYRNDYLPFCFRTNTYNQGNDCFKPQPFNC